MLGIQFSGEGGGDLRIDVKDTAYLVSFVFKIAGHIGSHTSKSYESNSFFFCAHDKV